MNCKDFYLFTYIAYWLALYDIKHVACFKWTLKTFISSNPVKFTLPVLPFGQLSCPLKKSARELLQLNLFIMIENDVWCTKQVFLRDDVIKSQPPSLPLSLSLSLPLSFSLCVSLYADTGINWPQMSAPLHVYLSSDVARGATRGEGEREVCLIESQKGNAKFYCNMIIIF